MNFFKKQFLNQKQKPRMIKPLRKSSSLLIFDEEDRVLLLKRSSKLSFGNALAFPGGVCESQDKVQAKSDNFAVFSKITALRQCLEETGILFYPNKIDITKLKELSQKEIGQKVGDLWRENLNMIKPVLRLMTPQIKNFKRYDCIFFTIDKNAKGINVKALHKGRNHENLKELIINEQSLSYDWKLSKDYLLDFMEQKIFLAPPQRVILGSLMGMEKPKEKLMHFDEEKSVLPITFQFKSNELKLMMGDKDFNGKKIMENEPASQSKEDLIREIKKYEDETGKLRRIQDNLLVTDYEEKNLMSFLPKSSKL